MINISSVWIPYLDNNINKYTAQVWTWNILMETNVFQLIIMKMYTTVMIEAQTLYNNIAECPNCYFSFDRVNLLTETLQLMAEYSFIWAL